MNSDDSRTDMASAPGKPDGPRTPIGTEAEKATPNVGIRWLGAIAVVVILLAMAFAHRSNVDSIDALSDRFRYELTVQKEKLAALASPQEVETASVRSAGDDEFVKGGIAYAKDNVDDFESFNVTFTIPVFVDVQGRGVGTLLGVKVLADNAFMNIFATYANGGKNYRVYDLYRNGSYFNFERPVQIIQGLSFQYNANYAFHRISCADVQKVIADVSGKFYQVEVQPFVGNAKYVAERKKFYVTFVEDSLYQCK